jgi:hypothetical protein
VPDPCRVFATEPALSVAEGVGILTSYLPAQNLMSRPDYFSTRTPFQNATYPLICLAASFGSG